MGTAGLEPQGTGQWEDLKWTNTLQPTTRPTPTSSQSTLATWVAGRH